jgi:hypothetical protein
MPKVCSIFSQLLQLFPQREFEQLVRHDQAERHAGGFSCWSQLVAMLFRQLGHAQSFREICGGLASCEGRLQHLGPLLSLASEIIRVYQAADVTINLKLSTKLKEMTC